MPLSSVTWTRAGLCLCHGLGAQCKEGWPWWNVCSFTPRLQQRGLLLFPQPPSLPRKNKTSDSLRAFLAHPGRTCRHGPEKCLCAGRGPDESRQGPALPRPVLASCGWWSRWWGPATLIYSCEGSEDLLVLTDQTRRPEGSKHASHISPGRRREQCSWLPPEEAGSRQGLLGWALEEQGRSALREAFLKQASEFCLRTVKSQPSELPRREPWQLGFLNLSCNASA